MKAYADTGFLVKLYLPEPESPEAVKTLANVSRPVLLSELSQLGLLNALNLNVFQKRIKSAEATAAWALFQADLAAGLFEIPQLSSTALHRQARALSERHSPKLGTRSLDLLHLAAAQVLGCDQLLTFDARQARAAKAEKLTIKPALSP